MKAREQIEAQVRDILSDALQERLQRWDERLPRRCVFNHRQPLDHRRTVDGEANENYNRISTGEGLPVLQTIGLCMLGAKDPEMWKGDICEDPIDAQRCPYFKAKQSPIDVYQEFRSQVTRPEWVREHMRYLDALLWVLGSGVEVEEPPPPPPPLPWWKRLLGFQESTPPPLLVSSPASVVVYLPPPPDAPTDDTRTAPEAKPDPSQSE